MLLSFEQQIAKFNHFSAMNASLKIKFVAVANEDMSFESSYRQIAKVTGQVLGMQYELIPSIDGEIGRQLPGGNWTGMIGMLLNNMADIILFIAPNEERRKVVNFSFPHDFTEMTFITQKPEIADRTFTFIQPFSAAAWLASIFSLFIASFVFHRLLRGRYRFDVVLFNMFRNVLQQSSSLEPVTRVQNLLHMTWIVGAMLLAYFYSAVLLSFLSFPVRSGIKDIPELATAVAKGTHRCVAFPGSFIPYELLKSQKESFKLIGQNLIENADVGSSDVFTALKSLRTVYITSRNKLEFLNRHYFVSDDSFMHMTAAVAYRKNFCCADKLHAGILRASGAGLFTKIQQDNNLIKAFRKLLSMTEESNAAKKLSLEDLSGVFFLLMTGHAIACFVFMLEIVNYRFRSSHQLSNRKKRKNYSRKCSCIELR